MALMEGPIPALVTPFTADGQVNVRLLRELVEWLLAQGAQGFFVNGTSGEGFLMSFAERQEALQAVIAQTRGRVPVLAHVGALATAEAVALAQGAAEAGADGVSAVPPFYYRVDDAGLVQHFAAIGAASPLPLYVYNIPANTGILVTAAHFERLLAAVPSLAGMKYTAHDLFNLRCIIELAPERLNVLSGFDEVFLAALSMGVHGAVGCTLNYMCRQYYQLYQAFRRGDLRTALELQSTVNRVVAVVGSFGSSTALTKAPLKLLGFEEMDEGRPPIRPLTPEEWERLCADLTAAGFFALERV